MAYIFRLHNNGANTNADWQQCLPYGSNVISQIVAPNGSTARKEITSIPSPFARIALVKSAFGEVVKSKDLNGNTIYHKMVSDSLDVAEIFFNFSTLKDLFKIVAWDVNSDLNALQNSHPQVYESLKVFLQQDAPVYNFDRFKRMYILVYQGPLRKTEMDVVGATSPSTLFFTPANDLTYISNEVSLGQDHPFDNQYQPLYKRDSQFVVYLFAFRNSYGNTKFAQDFPEVDSYLNATYTLLNVDIKNVIANFDQNPLTSYESLIYQNANAVDILGFPYHVKPIQPVSNSDFQIANTHYNGCNLPLVLPVEKGNKYANWQYVTAQWGNQNAAPLSNPQPWKSRTLPFSRTPYPYLTIDDFLEDTVLLSKRQENDEAFFCGNWDFSEQESVMLPLKPLFFEFFTTQQLVNGINGNPMLQMKRINNGDVSVELSIPTSGGTMTYVRNYYKDAPPNNANRGSIKVLNGFGLALMPMVSIDKPYYRIVVAHKTTDLQKYELECYLNNNKIDVNEIVRDRENSQQIKAHIFTNDISNMDFMRVVVGNEHGVVVPLYRNVARNKSYTFAVDFGTTNTHIEYTDGECTAKAFDVTANDCQLVLWNDFDAETKKIVECDIIPTIIGEGFKFPTRTALSESYYTDWNQAVIPMAHTNLPLLYCHRRTPDYDKITTDLKWSNEDLNIKRVESYIDNIMIMLRNKVLLGGGRLDSTKIVWFYPDSMTIARKNAYEQKWKKAYAKYFSEQLSNINAVIESVSPFKYYLKSTPAASKMVNIDIGGGTTDVVIADRGEIKYRTSFRFAANSIFGDGYTVNGQKNGVVKHYVEKFKKLISSNNLYDLNNIFTSFDEISDSANLASFYFTMKNDDQVVKEGVSDLFDWHTMLQQDDDFKVVFLLFYTAIMYHVAHLMKATGSDLPRHIAFSGNGSRVISILSPDEVTLSRYTKDIFCRVYGIENYDDNGLGIILTESPKVATCKGGINIANNNEFGMSLGEKKLLKSVSDGTFLNSNDTYATVQDVKSVTIKDVERFLDFTFENNPNFSIKDNFGIEQKTMNWACELCKRDLGTFFENGIEAKMKENSPEDPIEESSFFYPIIGILHALSESIHSNTQKL